MPMYLLQAAEDDGINVSEGTVVWILLVVLLVCLIVYVVSRIR